MRPEYSRFRSAALRISRLSHGPQTKTRPSRAAGLPRLARVLVVDDNRDIVTTLTAFLRMDGYETCEAFDGFEALHALEDFKPDALIVDIAMPGMSGWEVARAIRQRVSGRRPMLIAISGEYELAANKLWREKGGFDYCLSKPCDPNVVLNLLHPLKSSHH